jgi:hypothetical protein
VNTAQMHRVDNVEFNSYGKYCLMYLFSILFHIQILNDVGITQVLQSKFANKKYFFKRKKL